MNGIRFLRALRGLGGDRRGSTIVEFAIVAPVFVTLLFGIFDVGHGIYVQSVLKGAVQDAGRDQGLESGADNIGAIDNYVREQLKPVAPNGQYVFERKNYLSFSEIGRPEDFVDANANETYDNGECFWDENDNGDWDEDVGAGGLGGADDVVLYTVTLTYERVFPLWTLIGLPPSTSVAATTTLRNQPFGSQAVRNKVQICPE